MNRYRIIPAVIARRMGTQGRPGTSRSLELAGPSRVRFACSIMRYKVILIHQQGDNTPAHCIRHCRSRLRSDQSTRALPTGIIESGATCLRSYHYSCLTLRRVRSRGGGSRTSAAAFWRTALATPRRGQLNPVNLRRIDALFPANPPVPMARFLAANGPVVNRRNLLASLMCKHRLITSGLAALARFIRHHHYQPPAALRVSLLPIEPGGLSVAEHDRGWRSALAAGNRRLGRGDSTDALIRPKVIHRGRRLSRGLY